MRPPATFGGAAQAEFRAGPRGGGAAAALEELEVDCRDGKASSLNAGAALDAAVEAALEPRDDVRGGNDSRVLGGADHVDNRGTLRAASEALGLSDGNSSFLRLRDKYLSAIQQK